MKKSSSESNIIEKRLEREALLDPSEEHSAMHPLHYCSGVEFVCAADASWNALLISIEVLNTRARITLLKKSPSENNIIDKILERG